MAGIGSVSTTVLFVGADGSVVEQAVSLLDGTGEAATVTTVSNVADAITTVAETSADCVVCEYDLPDGTAANLVERLEEEHPALPVLVLAEDPATAAESVSAGATDALTAATAAASEELLAGRLESALRCDDAAKAATVTGRQYRTLIEHAEDIVTVIAPDGTIEYQSPSVERILGWDPGELVGEYVFNYVHPDDREEMRERFIDLTEQEGTVVEDVTFRFKRADESWAWVESVGSNRKDTTIDGYVFNSREIGERRERERELERYEAIVETIPDEVYTLDDEGVITSIVPPAGSELTVAGYEPDDLVGEHVSTVMDEADIETAEGLIRDLVTGDDTSASFEMDMVRKSGERIPFENHVAALPSADGEFRGTVGVLRNIAERKERERKLKLRNRAIAAAPIGITIADRRQPNTTIVYANDGFYELTGYDEAEIEGRSLTHLVGSETDEAKRADLEAAIDGDEPATVELLLTRADGTPFWSRISVAPVRTEEGDVTHTVAFQQDITEPKEYEQWIERRFDEFSDVLAEDLREPLREAQSSVSAARENGEEQALDAAEDWLDRADDLLDDLTTVHSFSVKSRDISEATRRGSHGDE